MDIIRGFSVFYDNQVEVFNLDNPPGVFVGVEGINSTLIYSGYTSGIVEYEIARRDGQGTITVSSDADITNMPNIPALTNELIAIELPHRTEFQVRVRQNSSSWSSWLSFKTRDKRFQSPDAITQLVDDSHTSDPTNKGNKTIVVHNYAKATVTPTASGATVVNTNTGYADTISVTETDQGATVVNYDFITKTARGATINVGASSTSLL
jgi:hypothetical protein